MEIPSTTPPDRRFYYLGRIIAVLELGARAHGEVRWLHLYYSQGFVPAAGLRKAPFIVNTALFGKSDSFQVGRHREELMRKGV